MSPLLVTAGHALCRLSQQVPEQRIALLTDVAQTPAIGPRILAGNQPQIAGNLLAATKSIRRGQYQNKSQCRDRSDL
jgi:hypothetical protein